MGRISIIPRPMKLEAGDGAYTLTPETVIFVSAESCSIGEYLSGLLAPATGLKLAVEETGRLDKRIGSIALRIHSDKSGHGPEGYTLSVLNDRVVIEAFAPAGLFYGCQTLRQLLPAAIESR
ncbi:MAG: glycoside hydrolase family 20 zincin-like fold domain-containing protein, partial [Chloroflexi bacterium]|nr:glycoside hydrolase family 20 zincin-like fold domain-containing protein [Chloroflexota bacterium]